MIAGKHEPLFPALRSAATPELLTRRHPKTGEWSWKRTGKGFWRGRFATKDEACADAERNGMPRPYRVVVVPFWL